MLTRMMMVLLMMRMKTTMTHKESLGVTEYGRNGQMMSVGAINICLLLVNLNQ